MESRKKVILKYSIAFKQKVVKPIEEGKLYCYPKWRESHILEEKGLLILSFWKLC